MNKTFDKHLRVIPTCLLLTVLIPASAQAQTKVGANNNRGDATGALAFTPKLRFSLTHAGFRLIPATSARTINGARPGTITLMPTSTGPNLPVLGSGTLGRLPKWTGTTSGNAFIGNSTIFEDKNGNVGIGIDTPTSKLTVNGTIQASGGVSVLHNSTLEGDGTVASPLGVGIPLNLTGSLPGFSSVLTVINNGDGGSGVIAVGGDSQGASPFSFGGTGLLAGGGSAPKGGGAGIDVGGGFALGEGDGGLGVKTRGGDAIGIGHRAGTGILAAGGAGSNGAANGFAGEFRGDVRMIGKLFLPEAGSGIILTSPDGATCRLLSIDNAGNLVLTAIPCP